MNIRVKQLQGKTTASSVCIIGDKSHRTAKVLNEIDSKLCQSFLLTYTTHLWSRLLISVLFSLNLKQNPAATYYSHPLLSKLTAQLTMAANFYFCLSFRVVHLQSLEIENSGHTPWKSISA